MKNTIADDSENKIKIMLSDVTTAGYSYSTVNSRVMTSIRKYTEIAAVLFKAQIAYRFDVAMTVLFTITKILFAFILWGAIFGQNTTIAGFTFPAMLSYYIVSSFLSQIEMSGGISGEISSRIRNGTFSKYMVVPVNTQGYFIAQTIGAAGFYLIFVLAATIVWAVLFRGNLIINSNITVILAAVLLVVLGLLFMMQLNYFLGILAFRFQDIRIFLMINEHIVSFVTGALVPLALLPAVIVSVMRFFPFYYVTYLPSMLLIGRNESEAATGIAVLAAWLLSLSLINRFMYNRMRVIYDGVGI